MSISRKRALLAQALLLAAALGLLAGCGANTGKTNSGMKTQSYKDDGYLGTTNANPHIPGRHMALNYADDAKLMQQSIIGIRGISGASVTFNGAEAYVTVRIDPGVDDRHALTLERQAASVLRFNFPRYSVHVRSVK